jgi:hypothetical protein
METRIQLYKHSCDTALRIGDRFNYHGQSVRVDNIENMHPYSPGILVIDLVVEKETVFIIHFNRS